MKLKVCGIRTPRPLAFCKAQKVDYVGFNFIKTSKRKVSTSFYNKIAECQKLQKVGIFQDQDLEEIVEITQICRLDIIQLHGNETPNFVNELVTKAPKIKVWKAFSISKNFKTNKLLPYCKNCELFLFDGNTPGSGAQILDKALLCDAIFESQRLGTPFAIAGGINTQNIAQIAQEFPTARLLDTASGVETEGAFDPEKLITLMYNLQNEI